jgi:hypothetical protein
VEAARPLVQGGQALAMHADAVAGKALADSFSTLVKSISLVGAEPVRKVYPVPLPTLPKPMDRAFNCSHIKRLHSHDSG